MRTTDDDRGVAGAVVVVAVLLFAGVAAAAGLGIADVGTPSGDAILDDAEERYGSADTVVGAATVTVANDTAERQYNASFTLGEGNATRVSVSDDNRTVVAGTNGTVAWVHDERTGVTRVVSNGSHGANATHNASAHGTSAYNATAKYPGDGEYDNESLRNATERVRSVALDWTEENTTATRTGREAVDGTDAWVVEVAPDNGSREGVVTHWVGVDSATVLKSEYDRPNATVTVEYTETRFNVSVADSTFRPPESDAGPVFESFEPLQNATSMTVPALGNDSYTFEEGRLAGFGGETAITRYDGPTNVTLVATTAETDRPDDGNTTTEEVAGESVNVTETGDGVAVAWERADRTVSLFADTDRGTALDLAADTIEATEVAADSDAEE
jgi:outer membrane lipoprotein-sorting protein